MQEQFRYTSKFVKSPSISLCFIYLFSDALLELRDKELICSQGSLYRALWKLAK
jgi:hypothetical protein